MKKTIEKIKRFAALILSFLMICALVPTSAFAAAKSGAKQTVTLTSHYFTDYSDAWAPNGFTVTIDGETLQAYCLNAKTAGPVGGTNSITRTVTVYECVNDYVRAALYFGYGGIEEIDGVSEYATHNIASYYWSEELSSDSLYTDLMYSSGAVDLYNYVEEHYSEVPDCFHVYYACFEEGTQDISWWEYTPGYLTLAKSSAASAGWVTDNDAYSLAGAVYGVYAAEDDAADNTNCLGTLTTDEYGRTGTLTLDTGTYYVKEISSSTGYGLDTETHEVTVKKNETTTVASSEPVKADSLTLTLYKTNEDGEDCGGIEGAVFKVTYIWSGGSAVNYYVTDSNGCIDCTDTAYLCDSEGNSDPSANSFPTDDSGNISVYAGTVTVEEVISPEGYLMSDDTLVRTVTALSDGTVFHSDEGGADFTSCGTDSYYIADGTIRGGVKFLKIDAKQNADTAQGDASLAGAHITVYNALGEAVLTVTSDEDGYAETSSDALPYGTYYAVETKASSGYLINEEWKVEFDIEEDGVTVDMTSFPLKEEVIRGGAAFLKIDAELDTNTAQGDATLEGAEITIYNASENAVYVNGSWYASGEAVMTVTTDEDGYAETSSDALPYGTYYAVETKASSGYLINEEWRADFTVTENGEITDLTAADAEGNDSRLAEQMIRGDISFIKLDTDGNVKAYTPFLISLIVDGETVEQHVVMTDENGCFDSSALENSNNTNALDAYLSEDGTAYTGACDSDAAPCGVWFGSLSALSDDNGAFLYGTYTIQELSCSSNEEEDLLSGEAAVSADGECVFAGYFVDLEVDITTQLLDKTLGAHMTFLSDEVTLVETINYTDLKTTSQYYFLVNICDGNGNTIASAQSEAFYPEASSLKTNTASGSLEMEITLSTIGYEGQALHAEAELYIFINDTWCLIGKYNNDTDDLDEEETVYVPSIDTTAADSQTGDHVGTAGTTSVTDTVTITNILAGESYTLYETLYIYDGETGELLTEEAVEKTFSVARNSIFTSYTYKYDTGNLTDRTVEMPGFEIDSSDLSGLTVVVCEELWRVDSESKEKLDDIAIASHMSLIDEDQSIYFVGTDTHAVDSVTLDHTGSSEGETATVTDTVCLSNLIIGQEYTVTGELIYQADCTDAYGNFHEKGDTVSLDKDASEYEITFTATETECCIELTYAADTGLIKGTSVVVFEYVYHNGIKVSSHSEISSKEQSVSYPAITTSASDYLTGDNAGAYTQSGTVIDTVSFTGLRAGYTYTLSGILMDRETKEKFIQGDGTFSKEITITVSDTGNITVSDENGSVTYTYDAGSDTVSGTLAITYEGINSAALAGESIVVFETLAHTHEDCASCRSAKTDDGSGAVVIASHADFTDAAQTICYAAIDTLAIDEETGDHVGTVWGWLADKIRSLFGSTDADCNGIEDDCQNNIIDTVSLENLIPGYTYTVSGVLMDAKTGEAVLEEGESITQTVTFTLSSDGLSVVIEEGSAENYTLISYDEETGFVYAEIDMVYSFDLQLLEDEDASIVVFEYLYHNGVIAALHTDLEDEDQSIYYPAIGTSASDSETGTHTGTVSETAIIVDSAECTNLIIGQEYTITGYPVYQEDYTYTASDGTVYEYAAGDFIPYDAEASIDTVTFTAEAETEVHELTYVIDSTLLQGTGAVVFEDLEHNGVKVAAHHDIYDEDQTIYYPAIDTELVDYTSREHEVLLGEELTPVDTVSLFNLKVGTQYKLVSILTDKDTGDVFTMEADEQAAAWVCVTEFTAEWENGTIEAEFSAIDTTDLGGAVFLAYEYLYALSADGNWVLVNSHTDTDDEDQTVYIPKIETSAADSGGSKYVTSAAEGSIIDTVTYTGLIAGKEYTLTGTLMDKKTGKAVTDADGNEIIRSVTFTPEESGGTIEMVFTVPADTFYGAAVVFEELTVTSTGNTAAVHEDIDDTNQTVYFPEIGTTLTTEEGEKSTGSNETLTLTDTVTYTNLEVGQTYTICGVLMDKGSEEAAVDGNGKKITGQTTFTADTTDGTVTVEFTFDPDGMEGEYTAFEELYKIVPESLDEEGNVITEGYEAKYASHTDLEDAAQTITIYTEDEETPGPKTGDTYRLWLWITLAAAAVFASGAAIGIPIYRKKRGRQA